MRNNYSMKRSTSTKSATAGAINPATQTITAEPSAEKILCFLQSHPNFISEHPELLEVLHLPHDQAGPAVSLIERQVAKLRENNAALNQELDTLIDVARENDALFDKTRRLTLSIMTASSMEQLTESVEQALRQDFDADASALTLFTSNTAKETAGGAQTIRSASNIVPLTQAQQAIKGIISSSGAICGSFRPQELAFLFNDQASQITSAAVAPLGEDSVIGVLAVGSQDPDRYHSTIGTVFLNYITEVLNIALPRLLSLSGSSEH
jgi:uncharacterized protein YigA (DUF484 family)